MTTRFTDYDIMLALLRIYSRADRSLHIGNILGAERRSSDLERELAGIEFSLEERAQAMRCARELQDLGLIVPTYSDLSSPEEWRVITSAGRDALDRGALDDLDKVLRDLSPEFLNMRRGAWRAANSSAPDTLRQAAHSGRELVSQVLNIVSPDVEVRGRPWFNPNPQKPREVTRKNRYKNAIEKRNRGWSESDLEVALKASDLLEAQYAKLSANAHLHGSVDRQTVIDALATIDMVLRILLV
ncbi:hypothetical protein GFM13_06410 [Rhizobium leguminosarum bv. viciae]|nr:hypothetical protein [Rhizobium leguminosarum bv. viciae]